MRTIALNVLAVCIVAVSVGCYSLEPHIVASGEPLEVRGRMMTIKGYYDDKTRWHPERDVYVFNGFYQGNETEPLDELDFLHIAGADEHAAELTKWRAQTNTATMISWGVTGAAVGTIAAGAGLMVAEYGVDVPEDAFETPTGQIAGGLIIGGGLLVAASFLVGSLFNPPGGLNDYETLFDPRKVGEPLAEKYNARLGEAPPADAPSPAAD